MLSSQVSEIKQQAVIEKAKDPNSSVSAKAAEEAIVDETRKAGGTAFQFDPDASSEKKAAQLNAVCSSLSARAAWPNPGSVIGLTDGCIANTGKLTASSKRKGSGGCL
jgi:hypothetical protein